MRRRNPGDQHSETARSRLLWYAEYAFHREPCRPRSFRRSTRRALARPKHRPSIEAAGSKLALCRARAVCLPRRPSQPSPSKCVRRGAAVQNECGCRPRPLRASPAHSRSRRRRVLCAVSSLHRSAPLVDKRNSWPPTLINLDQPCPAGRRHLTSAADSSLQLHNGDTATRIWHAQGRWPPLCNVGALADSAGAPQWSMARIRDCLAAIEQQQQPSPDEPEQTSRGASAHHTALRRCRCTTRGTRWRALFTTNRHMIGSLIACSGGASSQVHIGDVCHLLPAILEVLRGCRVEHSQETSVARYGAGLGSGREGIRRDVASLAALKCLKACSAAASGTGRVLDFRRV